jgi:hypothetical protein
VLCVIEGGGRERERECNKEKAVKFERQMERRNKEFQKNLTQLLLLSTKVLKKQKTCSTLKGMKYLTEVLSVWLKVWVE